MALKRYFIKFTYSVQNIDTGKVDTVSKNANIRVDLYTTDVCYYVETNCIPYIPYNETVFNVVVDFMIEANP